MEDLFEALKSAAMAEYDAVGRGKEGLAAQALAVKVEAAIKTEIARRPGHEARYHELLTDPHPSVRYSAALALKTADPRAALRVFREFSKTPSIGGGLSSRALIEVYGLTGL